MKKQAKVSVEGIKPLLIHAFKEEALDKKKSKSGSAGNSPDEWQNTIIMDGDRKIYLPSSYFFASIKEAGKYTKIGRGNIVKHVGATLEVSPDNIYLDDRIVPLPNEISRDSTQRVYLDVRSVVNPMTKGRNLRYRVACPPGWKAFFFISWEDSILSASQMEQLVKDAGLMAGTGCGRAIGFERFQVLSFQIC